MDIETLKVKVAPLLVDPTDLEHVEALIEALKDPVPGPWDRPWQVNRYRPETMPGIEGVWEMVARAVCDRMGDPDPAHRLGLVMLLLYAPSSVATPFLLERLADEELVVQLAAVSVLAEIGADQVVPAAMERLVSDDADVRLNAAAALGRMGVVEAHEALAKCLESDPDERVRFWAGKAIGEINAPGAPEVLLDFLGDANLSETVVQGVQAGLSRVGPVVIDRLVELSQSPITAVRLRAIEALEPHKGLKVDQHLVGLTSCREIETELAAAWVLMRHGHYRGLERLRDEVRSRSSQHQTRAARYLIKEGNVLGADTLITAYFDEGRSEEVRSALSEFPRAKGRDLVSLIEIGNIPARLRAYCDLVGVLGVTEATPVLNRRAGDNDPEVALSAMVSLARLGEQSGPSLFEQMLARTNHPLVRVALVNSLKQLSAPIPIEISKRLLVDSCAALVIVGIELLVIHPEAEAVDWIATILKAEWLRQQGKKNGYDPAQNDPVFKHKEFMARLLARGEAGRDPIGEKLRSQLQRMEEEGWADPTQAVAQVAMASLVMRGAVQHTEVIEPFMTSPKALMRLRALDALVSLAGKEVLGRATSLREDPNPVVAAWWERLSNQS